MPLKEDQIEPESLQDGPSQSKEEEAKPDAENSITMLSPEDLERQKELVSKWKEGQTRLFNGKIREGKTVVSYRDGVKDIEKDIELLIASPEIPERDAIKEYMRQRLTLIKSLEKELGDIPKDKVNFYIISSGNPNENEPVIMAIEKEYFKKFASDARKSSLCDNREPENGWKFDKSKTFQVSTGDEGRLLVSLLKDGLTQPGRLEIGYMKGDKSITVDLSIYFTDPKYQKFARKDANGEVLVPPGQGIADQTNQWIGKNFQYLPQYEKLRKKLPEMLKKTGVDDWKHLGITNAMNGIIFILATGETSYATDRVLKNGEFMTNYEDALTMVRDHKFKAEAREKFQTIYDEAIKYPEYKNVCEGLKYFLDEEPFKPI